MSARKALVGLVTVVAVSVPACTYMEPVEIPNPSPAAIRLVSVSPAAGSSITSTTRIVAELEYKVEKFEPKRFKVGATAAQTQPESAWSLSPTDGEAACLLHQAAGIVRVAFDVKSVWDKPNLKRPFEIVFSVDQLVGTWGVSVVAARTPPILFNPVGLTSLMSAPRPIELMR